MTEPAQKALDAALKIADLALKASQTKPKDGKPTYKGTPEQEVLSRAARLYRRVVDMNYDAQTGEAYGLLLSNVYAHAGKTFDSIEWAFDVIDLLREGEDLDVEDTATLESLFVEAVKSELASLKSSRSAKNPIDDPAGNHPARAREGAVPK